MTDLCITCKENSARIIRSSNLSTERLTEVSECMYIYSLTCIIGNTKSNRAQKPVDKERSYYRANLKHALEELKPLYTNESDKFNLPLTRPLNMLNIMAHYSFDYAQQVL